MRPFTFHQPGTLQEALGLLAEGERGVKVIAGGQSLLLALKERRARPSGLVSLAGLPSIRGVRVLQDGRLEVGAATPYVELARSNMHGWHSEIRSVCGNLADISVRNMGTIGGAACQAESRFDVPPLLVAAEAMLHVSSVAGQRTIPAESFFGSTGGCVLTPSELLTHITFPPAVASTALAFEKFRFRAFDAAIVTVACAVQTNPEGSVARARLVVGAVSGAPQLAVASGRTLSGCRLADIDAGEIGRRVSAEVLPDDGNCSHHRSYQAALVVTLIARAMARCGAGGRRTGS